MTLGEKIRTARISKGMTQKQLVGDHITRNMLSKIENDSATPSVRTLEYIAARLELPAGFFMHDMYSDGSSPDGLDDMRSAYRLGKYDDCLRLLESSPTAGTTDEGYLLRARASLAAAKEALAAGNTKSAKEYADAADYYNKEGIYYSAEIDAEMSLVLAECALATDISEFEENAAAFEREVKKISFSERYQLAKAEYLLKTGEPELALALLNSMHDIANTLDTAKHTYLCGACRRALGDHKNALELLKAAELEAAELPVLLKCIYKELEVCYVEIQNFKEAYKYAALQIDS